MIAKVKRISPETIKTLPGQSMDGLSGELRFSRTSDGMQRYAVMAVIVAKTAPIQKYQPHLVNSAVTPAKKIPMKKPMGAHAP